MARLYKHYSFDLWMTLIRSNPQYKYERARLIQERYNPGRKSLDEIMAVFRQVDVLGNTINEKTGGQLQAEELYLWVIGLAAGAEDTREGAGLAPGAEDALRDIDPHRLYDEMEEVVLAYPPLVYGPDTLSVLGTLRERAPEATFSLLSNTAFVKGRTLRKVLPGLGLEDLFAFQLYSDEAGLSKPNGAFFRLMLETLAAKRGPVSREDIVHVGDNPIADITGAQQMGIPSILINTNQQGIEHLLRLT